MNNNIKVRIIAMQSKHNNYDLFECLALEKPCLKTSIHNMPPTERQHNDAAENYAN